MEKNIARAYKVLEILQSIGEKNNWYELTDIRLNTVGYAEPGYHAELIAIGNWNEISRWDNKEGKRVTLSDAPERACKILEKLGFEIEWSDEVSECEDCGKLVRTSPDSYSWKPAYTIVNDCSILCHDCIEESAEAYLEELEGDPNRCMTLKIDLSDYGYEKYNDESYEGGFHPGQTDDPHKIAKELRDKGIEKFIFVLDENSQFYSKFSVWVKTI